MRLHRLHLRAVGPFAGDQTIDFEPLGAGGLFLLDGPTGAGKSTVLDTITFALYGPGEGAGWGRLHSHFAALGVEPRVQLEFSLRGVRQRVTRSPEFLRPKRRGDGTTREAAQVHLERWEVDRWVSRSSNKADVADMLSDDLGLTREQFTQVVLLPQGEFMRFLRANDDERRALLTRLFGTQLYDRITDELDRRRVVATRDTEAAEKRLRLRIGAAAQAAGVTPADQDALADLAAGPCEAQLDLLERGLASAASAAAGSADAAGAELAAQRLATESAAALAQRLGRLAAAARADAHHEATRAGYERAAQALAAAERAEPVRSLVAACAEADTAVTVAVEALLAAFPDTTSAPDAPRAYLRGEGADELRARGAGAARLAAELSELVSREQTASVVRSELARAQEQVRVTAGTVESLAARQRELPGEVATADGALRDAQARATELPALRQRHEALAARLEAVQALADLEPALAAGSRKRESTFERYERAGTRYLQLVQARLANMAAELAGALVDGSACAVCGSPEHPAPARPAPDAATADQVAAAADVRAAAERDRDEARNELATLDERRAALLATISLGGSDQANHAGLRTERAEVALAIVAAEHAAAGLAELEKTRRELEVERDDLLIAQQGAVSVAASARSRAASAEQAADDLATELRAAAAGHPSVAARRHALLAQASTAADLADAVATVGQAIAMSDAAVARATKEAISTGFADLAEARAAVLPRAQLVQQRVLVDEWFSLASRLRGALESAEFAGLAASSAPAAELAATAAAQALATADTVARQAVLRADRTRNALEQFTAARADVQRARREYEEVDTAAAPVVHLAKLAKGVAGQRRVALTTYVLRQWFEQVVAAANVRLAGMSSGRYELVRVDEGASRAERVGLTLQVFDRHTGEQRSARSLSGGETFYTSLALALGLADVVRAEAGGVDLDTLFIDEGFGSLDPDTLDQVMGVIDELRDRGRTVGIVSHVSELKERIAERIEVRRLPDGSSTLRVVA